MTLTEAIRLGSMVTPQAFGALERDGGACAIGAAIIALGCFGINKQQAIQNLKTRYPFLESIVPCLVDRCPYMPMPVGSLIAHLNDEHRWPREQIADWVETIEPREVEPSVAHVGETVA